MNAKRCSYNKHFVVTADDNKVCKHYYFIIQLKQSFINKLLYQWQPKLRTYVHTSGQHFYFKQLLN